MSALGLSSSWQGFNLVVRVTRVGFVRGCGCSFGSPLFASVVFGVKVIEPSVELSSGRGGLLLFAFCGLLAGFGV